MPRYVVDRTFRDGLPIPAGGEGAALCLAVVERNADEGVNWVHSYAHGSSSSEQASIARPAES